MITFSAYEPEKFVGLAQRMRIPTEDAVQRVVPRIIDQEPSEDVVKPGRRVRGRARPEQSRGQVAPTTPSRRKRRDQPY